MDLGPLGNILQDRSLPDFIRRDPGNFKLFLDAFYEYLEQEKETFDIAKNLRNYRDIDETLDEFVEHFRYEYLQSIPEEIRADKRLLVKYIKNFYLNKGNENSYKFLFRLLYDEEIEFYYPKVDILRASDGKWEQITSIKIANPVSFPNVGLLSGAFIYGTISNSTALVSLVITKIERNVSILELQLEQVKGTFLENEPLTITYTDDNDDQQVLAGTIVLGIYDKINVTVGGSGYKVDDIVYIKDEASATVGTANVLRVTRGPITSLSIGNPGIHYNGETKNISDFADLPMGATYLGNYMPDMPLSYLASSPISFPITSTTIPSIPDQIQIIDSSDSIGVGAFGHVVSVDLNGAITAISLDNGGNSYNNPHATVISSTGTGAVINLTGGGGSIVDVRLNDYLIHLATDGTSTGLTADFTQSGNADAHGVLVDDAGMIRYPGRWINTDGFLSSDKKLQDNFFYQDFSYVILSGITYNRWKDIVGKIIHPAGLQDFGQVKLKADIFLDEPYVAETTQTFGHGNYLIMVDGSYMLLAEGGHILLTEL